MLKRNRDIPNGSRRPWALHGIFAPRLLPAVMFESPSRRDFLQRSAAVAATGPLPGFLAISACGGPGGAARAGGLAQPLRFAGGNPVFRLSYPTATPDQRRRWRYAARQCHHRVVRGRAERVSPSDIPARIAHLEANGIQRQLLTHTVALGLDATIPLEDLRPLYRAFNDELADVVRRYPKHFLAVAALPAADPKWAAEELTRAHRDLGFIGGSLPSMRFATLEGARTLAPLFATAQKHGSHFFVHRGPARWGHTRATAARGALGYRLCTLDAHQQYTPGRGRHHPRSDGLPGSLSGRERRDRDARGFSSVPLLVDRSRRRKPMGSRILSRDCVGLYLDLGPYSRIGEWVRTGIDRIGADRILFGTDYGVGGGKRGDVSTSLATLEGVLRKKSNDSSCSKIAAHF